MKRAKGCCRQYICIYIYTDICVHNYMYCYILSLLRHHQLTTVVTTIWLQFYGQAIQQVDPQSSSGPWSEKRLMSWSGAQCTPEMMSLPWVCHGETSGNDDSSKKTFGHHVLRHPFFFWACAMWLNLMGIINSDCGIFCWNQSVLTKVEWLITSNSIKFH